MLSNVWTFFYRPGETKTRAFLCLQQLHCSGAWNVRDFFLCKFRVLTHTLYSVNTCHVSISTPSHEIFTWFMRPVYFFRRQIVNSSCKDLLPRNISQAQLKLIEKKMAHRCTHSLLKNWVCQESVHFDQLYLYIQVNTMPQKGNWLCLNSFWHIVLLMLSNIIFHCDHWKIKGGWISHFGN